MRAGLRIGSLTAVMRAESKRERVRSWERRKWIHGSSHPRKRIRESGAKQPRWPVVKQVWSELNPRLGHGESIKPRAGGRQEATVCGTPVHTQCNPEEIFTTGNLHTGTE